MDEIKRGFIYALKSNSIDVIYIGSTIQTIKERFRLHKKEYKNHQNNIGNYVSSYEVVKYDDCYVELIKEVVCNKNQLRTIESEEILKHSNCVNIYNPKPRTDEEVKMYDKIYYEKNKEYFKEYFKEYYEKNKQHIKEYYEQNKYKLNEKFNCECGGKYTSMHKTHHEKSKLHQDFLRYD